MPALTHARIRRMTALALTAGAVAAGTLTAAPAQATPTCTSAIGRIEVRDTTLTIGTKGDDTLDLIAAVSRSCTVSKVVITLTTPSDSQSFTAVAVGGDQHHTLYGVSVTLEGKNLYNDEAGSWKTKVSATSESKVSKAGPSVTVKRSARVSVNAKPEPVRKGHKITVTGKLERANWETGHYAGYAGRTVELQFKTGKGRYSKIKTVTTGKGGSLKTTVTAKKDGCFRYVFAGSGSTAAASAKGDCLDVR